MNQRSTATIPQPFQLKGEAIHEEAVAKLQHARQAQDDADKQKRIFKARPMPKDTGGFTPEKPNRVTVPKPMALQSEARAKEREQFDELMKVKEEEKGHLEEEQKRAEEEEEKRAVEELRKSQVFKARNMPNFDDPYTPRTSRNASEGEQDDGSPVMELHDWNLIMSQRKAEESEQVEAKQRAEVQQLRQSMKFEARRMPDFSKVWDPRSPRRVQSGPRPTSARKSTETSSWARASDRQLVETPTKQKAPTTPVAQSVSDQSLREVLEKSKHSYAMLQKLQKTSPLSRASTPGSVARPSRPQSASPGNPGPGWK